MADNENGKISTIESKPETEFEQKHLNDLVVAQAAFERAQNSPVRKKQWSQRITSPLAVTFISIILMVALASFAFGASMINRNASSSTSTSARASVK
jgi:hypothetical protein